MRQFIINLLLRIISVWLLAANVYGLDFEACMNSATESGGLTNVQRIQCLKTELHKQDLRLQAAYKQRFAQGNKHQRQLLKRAHHQWLNYRDSLCLYEKSFTDIGPHPDVNELFCRVDLTIEFTHKLQAGTN